MYKKYIPIIILFALGIIITSGVIFFVNPSGKSADSNSDQSLSATPSAEDDSEDYTYIPPIPSDHASDPASVVPTPSPEPEVPFVPATEMDLDPSSITVFVNKEYTLPKDYVPEKLVIPNVYFNLTYYDERTYMRPEAAQALEKLFAAAKEDGYELCGVSGYRSYTRQLNIFKSNILTKGKEHTLKYSAVPGASEHQTGLAIDVSCKSLDFDLSTSFSETPEGIWLSANAYRFGYIVRYPKGKAKITGYAYEPWHIRYVGKGLAKYLYENDLTLEEYYKYEPSKDFDFEAKYAYLINITPSPTPCLTPSVTPSITPSIMPSITPEITPDITPEITPDISLSVTPAPTKAVEPTDIPVEPTSIAVTVTPTPEAVPTQVPEASPVPGEAD